MTWRNSSFSHPSHNTSRRRSYKQAHSESTEQLFEVTKFPNAWTITFVRADQFDHGTWGALNKDPTTQVASYLVLCKKLSITRLGSFARRDGVRSFTYYWRAGQLQLSKF